MQPTVSRTSQVSYEVVEFHLPICFYVFIVQVGVEHDSGKRQQEYSVGPMKPPHCLHIALTITVGKCLQRQITTEKSAAATATISKLNAPNRRSQLVWVYDTSISWNKQF